MHTYKSRGIVLHSIKQSESNIILYLYTDLRGRQSYIVRAGSRKKGAVRSLFQPLFILDYDGIESSGGLHKMSEPKLAHHLGELPFDICKSTISLFIAEIIYKLVKEEEANPPLFDFLTRFIVELNDTKTATANFHLYFLVRLSQYLGFMPLDNHTEGSFFDIRQGCFTTEPPQHMLYMDVPQSEVLMRLLRTEIGQVADIQLSRKQRSEFLSSVIDFYAYHTDQIYSIRSIQILAEIF